MKSGRGRAAPIFEKKRFWPPILWVLALVLGVALGCAFASPELITAVVLAAFLGLNETSRWAYKTNLLICTAAAVVGTVAGVFSWVQAAFIFALLSVVCGYMLYFRDSTRRLLPYIEEFASDLSSAHALEDASALAVDTISAMCGGEAVFIAVTDGEGGLYLPEYHDDKRLNLKRNGGAVWKVFAAGRSYLTNKVDPSKDLPLDREARSLMSAPLQSRGEKLGVLQVESDQPYAFSEYDLSKMEILAFIVSQTIFPHILEEAEAAKEPGGAEQPKTKDEKKSAASARKAIEESAQSTLDLEQPEE